MASSNCIRCMMNELAGRRAAAAAFNPADFGTAKGWWEADDYAAGTAANKIEGSTYGALTLTTGSVVESATGWNGTSKTVDFTRLQAGRLRALCGPDTRYTVVLVMDITDPSRTEPSIYSESAMYAAVYDPVTGIYVGMHGAPWDVYATQQPQLIRPGYWAAFTPGLIAAGRQIWILDRYPNGVANTWMYVNGVARADGTLSNPYFTGSKIEQLFIGNGVSADVSGDQRWKATMVFTDLSVSIATLNAALAAKYGI